MQNTTDTTSPNAASADAQLPPARRPQSLDFAGSARSTLGVEWELALIDRDSLDLRQCAEEILQKVGPDPHVHGEMMLNTIELVSGARRTVAECMEDIAFAFDRVLSVTDPLRVDLASAGTHPFADPLVQKVTNAERYARLVDRTRLWGHQMLIFGTHVHVGVEDRSKVLPILKALLTRTGSPGHTAVLYLPMIGIGVAWASITGVPYIMAIEMIRKERRGVSMGVINMMIVIPQFIQTLTFGPIYKHLLGDHPVAHDELLVAPTGTRGATPNGGPVEVVANQQVGIFGV